MLELMRGGPRAGWRKMICKLVGCSRDRNSELQMTMGTPALPLEFCRKICKEGFGLPQSVEWEA